MHIPKIDFYVQVNVRQGVLASRCNLFGVAAAVLCWPLLLRCVSVQDHGDEPVWRRVLQHYVKDSNPEVAQQAERALRRPRSHSDPSLQPLAAPPPLPLEAPPPVPLAAPWWPPLPIELPPPLFVAGQPPLPMEAPPPLPAEVHRPRHWKHRLPCLLNHRLPCQWSHHLPCRLSHPRGDAHCHRAHELPQAARRGWQSGSQHKLAVIVL